MAPFRPRAFRIFSHEVSDDSDPSTRSRLRRGDSDAANGSGCLRRPTSGGALTCHLNRCGINTTVISIAAAAAAAGKGATTTKKRRKRKEKQGLPGACLAPAMPSRAVAVDAALALPFSIESIHIRSCEFMSEEEEEECQWQSGRPNGRKDGPSDFRHALTD